MDIKQTASHSFDRLKQKLTTLIDIVWATMRAGIPIRFWPLLLIVGLAIGIGLKIIAKNFVTIGYGDYRLMAKEDLYDINRLQDEVISEGGSLTQPEEKAQYPSCSLYE